MIQVVLLVAILVVLVAIGPLLTLWAWNTLFPMAAIDYNFFTWFAVIVLGGFFRANVSIKGKK